MDCLLFPIDGGGHWKLLVIEIGTKEVFILDSLSAGTKIAADNKRTSPESILFEVCFYLDAVERTTILMTTSGLWPTLRSK